MSKVKFMSKDLSLKSKDKIIENIYFDIIVYNLVLSFDTHI